MIFPDQAKITCSILFAVGAALVCGLLLGAALTILTSLPVVTQ